MRHVVLSSVEVSVHFYKVDFTETLTLILIRGWGHAEPLCRRETLLKGESPYPYGRGLSDGSCAWDRTKDLVINSHPLYR